MTPYALSVDYGTSNTVAVLRWPDGRTRPLLFDGSPLLPSAVYAMPAGHFATGRDAFNSARMDPSRFEPNPKRHIDELDMLLGEQSHPLPAIVAATLARVAQEARQVAGQPVGELIMTYPAEWGAARRAVLTEAAGAAGLPAPHLVPEPVAAGTYFTTVLGHGVAVGHSVVVYDLGAGTFDASVVRRTAGGFETLAYRGLDDVGGVDLDELVVQQIGTVIGPAAPSEWQRLLAPSDLSDRRAARTFRDDARMLKERLSRESSAALFVPLVDRDIHVTREEFEARSRALIAQTVAVTAVTMKAARTPRERLVGLFLVGGSTRMPLVATELHRAIGIAPTVLDQPELVVAEGALLVAGGDPVPVDPMPDRAHGRPRQTPPRPQGGPAAPMSPAPQAQAHNPAVPTGPMPVPVSPPFSPAAPMPQPAAPVFGPPARFGAPAAPVFGPPATGYAPAGPAGPGQQPHPQAPVQFTMPPMPEVGPAADPVSAQPDAGLPVSAFPVSAEPASAYPVSSQPEDTPVAGDPTGPRPPGAPDPGPRTPAGAPPMPVPSGAWPGSANRPSGPQGGTAGRALAVFTTTTGSIVGRAALRLLVVPVLFGAGLGLGQLAYELVKTPVPAWSIAGPIWTYMIVWFIVCVVRMATAGAQAQRLVVDGTGLTVVVLGRPHHLAWTQLGRVEIRRRGFFRRPILVAVPKRGTQLDGDLWWATRRAGADGGLAVADLRTLRANGPVVTAAVNEHFRQERWA